MTFAALAEEGVPPELVAGLAGSRGGSGLGGDGNEAGLALADKAELFAGGGLDEFIGVEICLEGVKPLVVRLKFGDLSAKAAFPLVKLVRANGTESGGDEEVGDGEGGDEQDDPAGRTSG
jgi:hypothetical protein